VPRPHRPPAACATAVSLCSRPPAPCAGGPGVFEPMHWLVALSFCCRRLFGHSLPGCAPLVPTGR
ncbi:unnamed protein product, partial [Amoebophrya sp. A120]